MMMMMKEENKNGPIYYIYEYYIYIYILYICMYADAYVRRGKRRNVCTFYDNVGRSEMYYYYRHYTREVRESEETLKKERRNETSEM